MAQAAYCSQCGTNVYVTQDGRCPQGHGPEFLSNYYETDEPGATQAPVQEPVAYTPPAYTPGQVNPVQPPKKKNTVLIVVLVIIALLVLCGVGVSVAMCQFVDTANEAIDSAIESSDVVTTPADDASTSAGTQGPDTTPALTPGVVRVTLGWDQEADMDLEIWEADGSTIITSAGTENEDIYDGTEGREYFDFTGTYGSGVYVVSIYFAGSNDGPDYANATVTVFKADGTTETRTQEVKWDPGEDQWHAFSIDATTGEITDINEFYSY